jgi:pyruvate/2-oxoglutarate dehydrogenase complex dihydrolipoamide dehydrogenase (E3) component
MEGKTLLALMRDDQVTMVVIGSGPAGQKAAITATS